MIVTLEKFREVAARLLTTDARSFDCETTGLRIWQNDRLFSLIIADAIDVYYFNFHDYHDVYLTGLHRGPRPNEILPRAWIQELAPAFSNPDSLWIGANAKYDMACLYQENIEIAGNVWCTEGQGRVERNDHFAYGLDAIGKRLGDHKGDEVYEYCKKYKLYRYDGLDAKGQQIKVPQYYRVPFDIIVPYGEQDAKLTYKAYTLQKTSIANISKQQEPGVRTPTDIMVNEMRLTKTLFEMEKTGILIDRNYVAKGCQYEAKRVAQAIENFKELSGGVDFVDSAKCLAPVFDRLGELYPLTDLGNPSFAKEVLEGMKSPIVKTILEHRDASKKLNTYYRNFLKYADANGRIHADNRQGGTKTGRIAVADPNLQNLTKEYTTDCASCGENLEDPKDPCYVCGSQLTVPRQWMIRRSFIPSPGNILCMLDYDQVEYRLMLDYAGEKELIWKILNEGLDVHRATAQMMKVTRQQAKTLNFMLLYGGGVAKLCMALFNPFLDEDTLKAVVKVHLWNKRLHPIHDASDIVRLKRVPDDKLQHDLIELKKAKELQDLYFSTLPKVKIFIKGVQDRGKARGWVRNWAGRVLYCSERNPAYKLPNHIIQGGAGDGMKIAMNEINDLLLRKKAKSKILIQVHDELDIDMVKSELDLIPEFVSIMSKAYPYKHIPLTVGVEYSAKSLADKQDEVPA